MKFKLFVTLLLLTTSLISKEIKIAVASNVSYAIEDLKKEFIKLYPDTKVQVILGSSGKLTAQISNGAPYQLFMSADMKYPDALYKKKIAITKPSVYAYGELVFLSNKKQDFSEGFDLLKSDKIKKIAIANPNTAPYGKATLQAMKNAKIYKDIKRKLVYAESISQTLSYTITAVDIGFVAKSSLFSPKMQRFKKGKNWSDIDSKLYTPINQGVVILKNGKDDDIVKAFYDFLLSKKTKEIFKRYGYLVPND